MLAVYLAQHTAELHYGSMFNTVPAWHPLRLAEDVALADILTRGRFRFTQHNASFTDLQFSGVFNQDKV